MSPPLHASIPRADPTFASLLSVTQQLSEGHGSIKEILDELEQARGFMENEEIAQFQGEATRSLTFTPSSYP
jgi:hypothetical protein